jgi:hypothetical protein
MNQISLLTEVYYQQRHNEILKEVASYHLIDEALKSQRPYEAGKSKLLAWVGKQLQEMGTALEDRYGNRLAMNTPQLQESNQGNCA